MILQRCNIALSAHHQVRLAMVNIFEIFQRLHMHMHAHMSWYCREISQVTLCYCNFVAPKYSHLMILSHSILISQAYRYTMISE